MRNTSDIETFLDLCHRVYEKDLVRGAGGNVSVRSGDRILISPTGRCLGVVDEDDVVQLGLDGTVIGAGRPSKEWRMHLSCYGREDVRAVVHVHSAYAVGVACLRQLDHDCSMPVYSPGYSVRVGKLPAVAYMRPGSSELAQAVATLIARRNSVLLANHGVVAVGASADQAFDIAEEIEENARLHFLLDGRGRPLDEQQQAALAGRY
ncbi:class II aldolase/adducin family protein [Xanthobacteraceae bacterium Astr-EGSB]|uniref:class II aldolase/adducin family protein n=1 Tax=Astrobacterium formosum TaxID=3069710 RepID=UPI0027AFD1C0|nr:class II aldolase/adducin family protein [Xanthobacteraceae bacterium Astr-EGSB]